ncbi:hypothetical protein T492DRAFT_847082 [Pavlovales sp. CCMP2436]|nr:hypothetical protein T492DRAFT_847082 [Pavlovales sp. CCMP2436]
MSFTVLRPYARKFTTVYSQVVDVAAVKISELEAWTLKLHNALTQYGASEFFGNTTLVGDLRAFGAVNFANLEASPTFTSDTAMKQTITVWPRTNWTVSASSTQPGYPAFHAFDKMIATAWRSADNMYPTSYGSQWVQIKYPLPTTVGHISLTNSDNLRDFTLSASPDGSTWTEVLSRVDENVPSSKSTFFVTNVHVSCMYWRLTVLRVRGASQFSSVGKWELYTRRGAITLTTDPISMESFKVMLIDAAGVPVSAVALVWTCDVNLCLLKNGKIVNSGLYSFAGLGGPVTKRN